MPSTSSQPAVNTNPFVLKMRSPRIRICQGNFDGPNNTGCSFTQNHPEKVQTSHFRKQTTLPLTTVFNEKYEKILYRHLKKVITSNNITLELQKTILKSITNETEQYLCYPPEHITRL